MELSILGCHGGESSKHKTSSFLVDGVIALDAGAITSMLSLEDQRAVRSVLVSHAHLDHVKDLAALADNRCQQGGPTLRVFGVPATIAILREHFFNDLVWPDFTRIATPVGPTVELVTVEPEATFAVADGYEARAVLVHHTIDTCAFVVDTPAGAIAYSGDTGPTDRFWEVLSGAADLRALLMEVSFPDEHHALAKASGHHTPETLAVDLDKLHDQNGVPTLLYHIKPVFEAAVEKQLARIRGRNMEICRLGEQFIL
ncbi:MAG: 3',5'-cyclic-nucleotide phosphodiesterase [Sandaracinaceae bacterium]|nr:3',5'-cyclic-nucleotide phosphodiesterase [Sandaracinaceae bacterium]